eukprot:CAMPEP_0194324584 /NCGR_PEP_ID=MMETSP0171-20130528/28627_1 /TAXON_ID=218684 /ORGANISM="Corethron pennatum, Strain L29A3" /LENGTH=82 /DNA_ID=CAMNT_0039083521 /DNA_START=66 /DNA_END=314 /DNA_ORIENTATION=+
MRATPAVRSSFKSLFRTFDMELESYVSREVAAMDISLEPVIYSYRRSASAASGAFSATPNRMGPDRLVRVERPVATRGLFKD